MGCCQIPCEHHDWGVHSASTVAVAFATLNRQWQSGFSEKNKNWLPSSTRQTHFIYIHILHLTHGLSSSLLCSLNSFPCISYFSLFNPTLLCRVSRWYFTTNLDHLPSLSMIFSILISPSPTLPFPICLQEPATLICCLPSFILLSYPCVVPTVPPSVRYLLPSITSLFRWLQFVHKRVKGPGWYLQWGRGGRGGVF